MTNTYVDPNGNVDAAGAPYITHESKDIESKIAAMQAAAHAGLGAAAGVAFPFDPSENNPESDVSVVYNSDGSVNVLATMQKLENMLYYAAYGDPSNTNVVSDIAAMITNISGIWGSLSQDDQNLINSFMGATPTGSDGQTSLGYELVQWANRAFFYINGGDVAKTMQDATALQQTLQGLGGRCGWMDNLIGSDNTDLSGQFQYWMTQHTGPGGVGTDMSLQEFTFWQGLQWEQYLIQATGTWFQHARTSELSDLYATAGKNTSLLFVMLMSFLCHDNDQMQIQMTGKANTNTLLSNVGGDINKMLTEFKNMNGTTAFGGTGVTNQQAQSFFAGFMDFFYRMKDSRVSSLYPQVQQVANYIDGTGGQGLVTTAPITVGSKTYPVGTSFGDIYTDCQSSGDYTALADAFNQIMPTTTGPGGVPVIPQGWTDVTNDLQQLATTIPSQSQGVSTEEQSLQGSSDKETAAIQAGFSMIVEVNKFANQQMASSSA